MKNLTIMDVLRMRPCEGYGTDRVKGLWAGRESLTPLEILGLDIPIEDRFWVVLRYDTIGQKLCDEIACDIADHVLPIFEREYPDDKRPREAIEITRLHIAGKATGDARAAAGDAAGDVEMQWQSERVRAILNRAEPEKVIKNVDGCSGGACADPDKPGAFIPIIEDAAEPEKGDPHDQMMDEIRVDVENK